MNDWSAHKIEWARHLTMEIERARLFLFSIIAQQLIAKIEIDASILWWTTTKKNISFVRSLHRIKATKRNLYMFTSSMCVYYGQKICAKRERERERWELFLRCFFRSTHVIENYVLESLVVFSAIFQVAILRLLSRAGWISWVHTNENHYRHTLRT